MPFSREAGFGATKPSGTPCHHLRADDRCSIHATLREDGWPGCTVVDCFGAGQQVSQVTYGGVSWRQLDVEGFDRLAGKGISYGAARSEAANTHGLDVHIVGAGNSAGQAAMFFSTHARSVTIVYRGASLEKSMSRYLVDQLEGRANVHVLYRNEVTAAHGDSSLEAIDVVDATGETTRLESGGVFIFIGADAETGWLPPEIALDPKGYVLTGADVRAAGRWELERDPYLLETSVPGIFACGDVRFSPVKRVASAVGEGSMAIAFVHQFLRETAE
jgi:thioredoxin reductase (NADPH)